MKQLPHDVDTLEPCFIFLQQQVSLQTRAFVHIVSYDADFKAWFSYSNWETKYVFLLWLRMLCLIPFDICSIDSTINTATTLNELAASSNPNTKLLVSNASSSKLVMSIVKYCSSCLSDTGPTRDAAAICLSTLLTRPDMEAGVLNHFIEQCISMFKAWVHRGATAASELSQKSFEMIGMLQCSCQVFKSGHRDKILPHAADLLDIILQLSKQSNQILVRKLVTKLIQRIGMTFLPPRVLAWRYQRGQRSLMSNLNQSSSSTDGASEGLNDGQEDDENDVLVPEEMDSIFEYLLSTLGDKDTIVRWSAAKGIGRLTCRLPMQMADDLVAALLQSFSQSTAVAEESDSIWHGGCLALAELARRGALLPSRLDETVPVIIQAIKYDVVRGYHSVGAHVRDAACYVCWAFARAYSPHVLHKYMIIDTENLSNSLAGAMLTTSLFDREVNCRRASSAAYQENVGRQGNQNFANGLEIIALADYFSLGNRKNAYTSITLAIAKLSKENFMVIWQYLVTEKLDHWDIEIRQLAATALGQLTMLMEDKSDDLLDCGDMILSSYRNSFVLNSLHPSNASLRHGSILAVAEVTISLFKLKLLPPACDKLAPEVLEKVFAIVPELNRLRLYRGKGSEYLRVASCNLITSIAMCNLQLPNKMLSSLLENINDNIKQPHESIQLAAQKSLRQYLFSYFGNRSKSSSKLESMTLAKYMDTLIKEENVAITRGHCLALGCLPWCILNPNLGKILSTLKEMCQLSRKIGGDPDPETRKNALLSLSEIIERHIHLLPDQVILSNGESVHPFVFVWRILVAGCNDYSTDKRGDTGSWSRIVSLEGLERLIFAYRRLQKISADAKNVTSTCYGLATILDRDSSNNEYAWVDYPEPSLGSSALSMNNKLFIPKSSLQLYVSTQRDYYLRQGPAASMIVKPSSLRSCEEELLGLCFRQLAERLDSVRVAAGNIVERLVSSPVITGYLIMGREIILAYQRINQKKVQQHSSKSEATDGRVKDIDDDGEDQAEVATSPVASSADVSFPWNKSTHVFAFLKHILILLPSSYMSSILPGLIMSIGGLSESIAREAFQVVLEFHAAVHDPSRRVFYRTIDRQMQDSFSNQKKPDRFQAPLLKSIDLFFRHEMLQPNIRAYDYNLCFGIQQSVLKTIAISADVSKLKSCIDILIHMLMTHGIVRIMSLTGLVHLLSHRFPKIRTCKLLISLNCRDVMLMFA
jgi:tubulin-specific chaperone D